MVAYDDHFLREPFIRFDQLIANDHRLPFIVRSAFVWVETSRTNWVSARRVDLCLVTGRKPISVSCPEVLAAVAFVVDLGLDTEVKISCSHHAR